MKITIHKIIGRTDKMEREQILKPQISSELPNQLHGFQANTDNRLSGFIL